jgi:ectoine hydroxylase-related dioxygenase (phytanoyl-CoA dioxygenase family)
VDARARLERDGFVTIEGALDPDRLERAVAAVDRVWEGGALHLLGFVGLDEEFVDLVDHQPALDLVLDVLGTNVYVYHCHLDVHPRLLEQPAPTWRWHQDGGRQNVELESPRPRLSLKVAYFLTDVLDVRHGALSVIPGSHVRDRLDRPPDGSTTPPGATPLLVRAGTAVVFDRRLWHARGDNLRGPTRKALFYGYAHRWIRPRDELLGVDGQMLERLDPVRRQLLGGGASAIGYWIPSEEDVPLAMR